MTTSEATHRAIDAVWRIEAAKVIAGVARMVRDVGLAEELAQDALVAALEHWPDDGVPDNPGAWLMRTAKNRALDRLRQEALHARKHEELGADLEALQAHVEPDFVDALAEASADDIGDDLLRLVFTACHPLLPTEGRVALTVRLLGGLATDEIARAFLVPEATIAQRIVRAKRTLAAAKVPFEVPGASERAPRLASVLEVVYLIFNEGYSATAGDDWMRPALCDEALRLGRVLAGLVPAESEVHGLVALMELQASRAHARVDAQGRPVLLLEQDRSRWDPLADPPRPGRARALPGARRQPRSLCPAGRARRLPCRGAQRRRDRLAAHRRPLRRAGRGGAVAGGRAEPRGRGRHGARRPRPASPSSTRCATSRRSPAITCCRRCAATCSPASAAPTRRAPEFERAAAMTRNQAERRLLLERAGGAG